MFVRRAHWRLFTNQREVMTRLTVVKRRGYLQDPSSKWRRTRTSTLEEKGLSFSLLRLIHEISYLARCMDALGISSVNLDSEGHFLVAQKRREEIFFDEGASCLCFVGVEGTCIFSRGYLAYLRGYLRYRRVPHLFAHFHYYVFHRALGAQTRQQTCKREFCDENF